MEELSSVSPRSDEPLQQCMAEEVAPCTIESAPEGLSKRSPQSDEQGVEIATILSSELSRGERTGSDELSSLDMRIMKLRTSKQRDVNFFIDPVEFLSVKTVENIHTYLWISKDLSWTQNWYWPGLVFGGIAMLLSFIVCINSLYDKDFADAWHDFAQLCWLVSNFVWMTGDFHDDRYPNAPSVYDHRAQISQYIMIFSIAWLGLYYLVIRPFNMFNEKRDPFCRIAEKSWISRYIFKNWNEYERLHIFFWILKDFGWNVLSEPVWFIGLIPTLAMSIDFAWIVANVNGMIVESAHFIAQFIWVLGNAFWAYGELYYGDRDEAYPIFSRSSESHITYRWYSSWALLFAFLPIVLVYLILTAYSLSGYITGNLAIYQNPIGSNSLLNIHALRSNDPSGRHTAIQQSESDIQNSFSQDGETDVY